MVRHADAPVVADRSLVDDPARLAALARSQLMDSAPEAVFDRVTQLAARLLGTPIATLTLLDAERQFFKSAVGELGDPAPVSESYCQYTVGGGEPFTVTDVRTETRMAPRAVESLARADLVAYAGVPLTDGDGQALGTLCTMDRTPREWSAQDLQTLSELAGIAATELRVREAGRALAERERELSMIIEGVHEAFVGCDGEGAIHEFNPAAETMFGISRADAIGTCVLDRLAAAEGRERVRALLGGDHPSGDAPQLDTRARHEDGHEFDVELSVGAVALPEGRRFTLLIRDVTERKVLARELEVSERRFRHIYDRAPGGVTIVAPDRTVISANAAFCAMVGYPESALIGRTFESITLPDDNPSDIASAGALVTGELSRYTTEKRYVHRDGHIVHARLSATLVRDEAGEPQHFIAHTEDVTAARAAELALREARELLEESQAAAHVGSWSLNLESSEIAWSAEQFRLHGLEPGGAAPTVEEFIELVHPADRPALRAVFEARGDTTATVNGDYRVLLPDGRVRTLAASAVPLATEPGRARRIAGTTRDVTAEREARGARREVEERQQRLLSSLPDTMVVLYDAELRCVDLQGRLVERLGIDPAHYLGRRLPDFVDAEEAAELVPAVRAALAGEQRLLHFRDEFEIEFGPYHGDGEQVTGAFTVWRDVSARLEREREHRTLATMVGQSEDAIEGKNLAGEVTAWSDGATRMYGYSREEAMTRPIKDLIVPPELHAEEDELMRRVRGGATMQVDTVRRHRDGRLVDVSISASPITDPDGTVIGVCVIGRDISQRIAEQAARREIEERLRVTVEHAPIGVALIDLGAGPTGRLESVNDAFRALLADPDPVATGATLTSFVHPDDLDALRDAVSQLASGPHARIELEVRCLYPDGHVGWLLLTGAAVPSADGLPHLAVVHALDIGERKRFEGQLQHLADHDALTGLFNRRRFESELTRMVSLVDRYGRPSALLGIDLDGFKYVNDTMGHSYGDELITRVGAALRGCLRETDVIGRLGGDEFAVILNSVGPEEATLVADKVLHAIEQRGVVTSGHRHASVTASIGVAPFGQGDGRDAEALLVDADLAMYRAKESGKNRIALVDHGAGAPRLAPGRSWLTRLRTALDDDRFELFAQPIRRICASGPERYELLLRMRGEDGELIAPGTFLYNAERFDLIQEIDRWVFHRALSVIAAHEATGSPLSASVNMSGKTLSDPELIDDLTAMLADCPIPRDRLIVEVTETAAIVNIERAREVARALRTLGCRFALDDFGAGFASFYYLKHLDFDYVKIDGEFVRSLGNNATDPLVIRSVVDIARGLGAQTIAEFVGDETTVTQLRELGVDYGQGYHLGRPGPLTEILPGGAVALTALLTPPVR